MSKPVVIDGISYVPEQPRGNRAVVVFDRGWIFAGDVTERDGRIRLDRVVWLFRWESIGLDGLILDPKSTHATLKQMPSRIDAPLDAEIYRIPVCDDWGLM